MAITKLPIYPFQGVSGEGKDLYIERMAESRIKVIRRTRIQKIYADLFQSRGRTGSGTCKKNGKLNLIKQEKL